jgi:hypothetical protein
LERFVTLDVPLAFSDPGLNSEDQAIRAYEFTFNGIYEPTTLASMLQLRCQNDRTAAY